MTDPDTAAHGSAPTGGSPVIALLTLAAVWDSELGAELGELSLTTRKYGLLAHVQGSPGISFSELARRSRITVQSAHTAVKALQSDGYVQDGTAHAGSASNLRITAAGERALVDAARLLARLDVSFSDRAPELAEALRGLHEEPFGA